MLRRKRLAILLNVVSIPENQLYNVAGLGGMARLIIWNWVSQKLVTASICLLEYF